ncbi:hypothetical protein [Rhodococcus sp. IEGM 1379]|uniref:hypothetical protein n=1 Tax=Rhodococcus sp. IEGM 1379 TaxID=3047086 RepID=UPI0024B87567|nr:hypothetical protein [Rhodococcus sp. IEGM 1379]MDI9918492.1 hypothetical protein [Rhodococcus sp. IEGM 1379]
MKGHWKLVSLGAAFIVATALIVVTTLSNSPGPDAPTRNNGPVAQHNIVDIDLSSPPQQAWELDVRMLTGNSGDVLLSMPSTLDSYYGYGTVYYGYGTVYQVGNILVAATANPVPKTDESSASQGVGNVSLIGINPDNGTPLWKTRIGGAIRQCSQQNKSTIIACWGNRRVAFLDTSSGALLSDLGTDFDLNGASHRRDGLHIRRDSERIITYTNPH